MSKLRAPKYFAITNFRDKPLSFYSLKNVPGIYMLTNKINKKIYIGRSSNLQARFYHYLDVNRLNNNKSSRIHKALLKYGYSNFSVSILELGKHPKMTLNKLEDFFILVFKPQYNIARSTFNLDIDTGG